MDDLIKKKHRAYVGPTENYDRSGSLQFCLLTLSGLRSYHKVLDIGCGSLRLGKLLIPFLESKNYFGVEPEEWLIESAIDEELGSRLIELKEPKFLHNENFDFKPFKTKFDFCIAQSIFSHTTLAQLEICIHSVAENIQSTGSFLATAYLGDSDYTGDKWVYPECVSFKFSTIKKIANDVSMNATKLDWPHPNGQIWILFTSKTNSSKLTPLNNLNRFLVEKLLVREFIDDSVVCGYTDDIRLIGSTCLLNGWAIIAPSEKVADWIIIRNQDTVIATAKVCKQRSDVSAALSDNRYEYCGWEACFQTQQVEANKVDLKVYAYDEKSQNAYLLGGVRTF